MLLPKSVNEMTLVIYFFWEYFNYVALLLPLRKPNRAILVTEHCEVNHRGANDMPTETDDLPRTREEAKALGAKYYRTDRACAKRHVGPRTTVNGNCVECNRARRAANP